MKIMFTGTGEGQQSYSGNLPVKLVAKYGPEVPRTMTLGPGSVVDLPDDVAQWYLDNRPTDFVKVGESGKPEYGPYNAPPKEPEPIEKPAHRGRRGKMFGPYPNK